MADFCGALKKHEQTYVLFLFGGPASSAFAGRAVRFPVKGKKKQRVKRLAAVFRPPRIFDGISVKEAEEQRFS